jgi:hypothetical protein
MKTTRQKAQFFMAFLFLQFCVVLEDEALQRAEAENR